MVVRSAFCCILMLLAAIAPAGAQRGGLQPVGDTGKLERDVLAALNAARADPARYAASLRAYGGFFHARVVTMPGLKARFMTEEGVAPVNEAIDYLGARTALAPLGGAPLLAAAAGDHAAEQGGSGAIGHFGADGSDPGERARRHGGGGAVAEVITYGGVDAADVIRQLVVDDGVPDRGHRFLLFSSHLAFAGVACGPHPRYRTMCVIDMADTPDGRSTRTPAIRFAQR